MNATRYLFTVLIATLSVQLLAAKDIDNSAPAELKDLTSCNGVQQSVKELLDFVIILGEKEDANDPDAEAVKSRFEKEVSSFTARPHLGQKVLCLQHLIEKGDGKYSEAALIVLNQIRASVETSRFLSELISYLNSAELWQTDRRRHITELLSMVSWSREGKRFERWKSYLKERKDDLPLELIEWMYEEWTDPAFETLIDVYTEKGTRKRQELLDAANTLKVWKKMHGRQVKASPEEKQSAKQKAIKELTDLVKYQEWWVDLYVVEKMKKHPELESSPLIEILKKAKHPLVQEAIKDIEKK